jgi:hypothetical protein
LSIPCRLASLITLLACALAGCGGHSTTQLDVATVDGSPITQADLRAYVSYSLSFYAWAYGTDVAGSGPACAQASRDPGCLRVRRQALRRLLEEKVIERYALSHGIALSPANRVQAARETSDLLAQDTTAAQLLSEHKINRAFITVLLDHEMLIRKVEAIVSRGVPRAGESFHLRELRVPRIAGIDDARVYRQAVNLATDGKPVPLGTSVRTLWVAIFHLPSDVLKAVTPAARGQFVGPFPYKSYYLDVQFLGRGTHLYGRPARLILKTRRFRDWLNAEVLHANPRCLDGAGHDQPCPAADH